MLSKLTPVLIAALATAQQQAVVPALAATLPGNAALSLPLRWSEGALQVVVDHALLPPAACAGGITGIRLRRPAFVGEPGYGPLSRTLTVRAGTTQRAAAWMLQFRDQNTPANAQVVFGPTAVQVAASGPLGAGDALGPWLLDLPFTVPIVLPAANDHLFLEIESSDPPFAVASDNWIDAVQFAGGIEGGYAAPLGNGGCGGVAAPRLLWSGAAAPSRSSQAALQLSLGPANALALALVSLDPQARAPGGTFAGFGAGLAGLGLPGCFQWSAPDLLLVGHTSLVGIAAFGFAVPGAPLHAGDRIGVQAAVLDPAANPAGIALSNGVVLVLDQGGVGARASSLFLPGPLTATSRSPWYPFVGLMPVLTVVY